AFWTSSQTARACVKLPRRSYSRASRRFSSGLFGSLCRACSRFHTARSRSPSASAAEAIPSCTGTSQGLGTRTRPPGARRAGWGRGRPGEQPGQPPALEVVAEPRLLGAAEGLAVEQVGRVEPAAVDEQVDAGEVAARGHELPAAVEVEGGLAALLRGG